MRRSCGSSGGGSSDLRAHPESDRRPDQARATSLRANEQVAQSDLPPVAYLSMRRRGLAPRDDGDALALTFARPGARLRVAQQNVGQQR